MEIAVELPQRWIPTWHGLKHGKLVSVVQPNVLVGWPKQNRIDAAICSYREWHEKGYCWRGEGGKAGREEGILLEFLLAGAVTAECQGGLSTA